MSKATALIFLLFILFAAYLHWQHKLLPVLQEVAAPVTKTGYSAGRWLVALVVFVAIVSFVPDNAALILTALVAFGALLVDAEKQGQTALIPTLFAGGATPTTGKG